MTNKNIAFFPRLLLACHAFWKNLTDSDFAQTTAEQLKTNRVLKEASERSAADSPVSTKTTDYPDSALQLLGLLQRDGRFIDFIEEDVTQFSDAEIGAAVHLVHAGCRKVLREHLKITSVKQEPEGSQIVLEPGFDVEAIQVTGNVMGSPPFQGTLTHRGWRVEQIDLPSINRNHNLHVLATAEIEL